MDDVWCCDTSDCHYEAAIIEVGCLIDVIVKYKSVFGEPGKLAVADLPLVESEDGACLAQCPYQIALHKHKIVDTEIN